MSEKTFKIDIDDIDSITELVQLDNEAFENEIKKIDDPKLVSDVYQTIILLDSMGGGLLRYMSYEKQQALTEGSRGNKND